MFLRIFNTVMCIYAEKCNNMRICMNMVCGSADFVKIFPKNV